MESRGVSVLLVLAGLAGGAVASGDALAAQCGKAAWYDLDGQTASGERSSGSALAAAHRTLPFGTKVRVDLTNIAFDAALCANALHVMEHPERALREFARVLAPDGLLVAPTFLHGVDGARRALSRALSVVSPFVAHTRFSEGTLRALVERSGFMVERCEQLPGLFPIGYLVATVSVKQDQVRDRGPARPQS